MDLELNASCAYGHSSRVFDVAFHPGDPGLLASVCEDGNARVWSYNAPADAWEQVTCCTGHTSEALRVAWSPDGTRLATGGADGCVKLWRTPPVGGNNSGSSPSSAATRTNTYGAQELAAFREHPEEVYALEFLPNGTDNGTTENGSSGAAAAAVGAAAAGGGGGNGGSTGSWLVAGSGQSLFLWDLEAERMVYEAFPPTARTVDPKQPARGPDGGFPPYIFGLARQRGAGGAAGPGMLAAACCDGGARLWRPGGGRLDLVGEVQAHVGDIGTACLFTPSNPNLMACISKGGELSWVDLRRLTSNSSSSSSSSSSSGGTGPGKAVVARQRVAGPVFACALVPAGGFGGGDERLAVVGVDHVVRLYDVSTSDFGPLDSPMGLPMPGGYSGRLLTVAVSSDGTRIAAAGEPVPSEELRPLSARRQGGGGSPQRGAGPPLAPAAAAAVVGAAAGRRRRAGRPARVAGLDALTGGGSGSGEDSMFEQLSLDDGGGDGRAATAAAAAASAAHEGGGHEAPGAGGLARAPLYVFEVVEVAAAAQE